LRGHGESNGSLWYTLDLEELVERDHLTCPPEN
ncbi:MAG: hypothetical protein RL354_2604, partial [Planctomycetota bacterium]